MTTRPCRRSDNQADGAAAMHEYGLPASPYSWVRYPQSRRATEQAQQGSLSKAKQSQEHPKYWWTRQLPKPVQEPPKHSNRLRKQSKQHILDLKVKCSTSCGHLWVDCLSIAHLRAQPTKQIGSPAHTATRVHHGPSRHGGNQIVRPQLISRCYSEDFTRQLSHQARREAKIEGLCSAKDLRLGESSSMMPSKRRRSQAKSGKLVTRNLHESSITRQQKIEAEVTAAIQNTSPRDKLSKGSNESITAATRSLRECWSEQRRKQPCLAIESPLRFHRQTQTQATNLEPSRLAGEPYNPDELLDRKDLLEEVVYLRRINLRLLEEKYHSTNSLA